MNNKPRLTLRIITPEGIIIEKSDLISINIDLADGNPIGIRPGHAPLIAETKEGTVTLHNTQEDTEIKLHSGVMDIRDNSVTILTAGLIDKTTTGPESSSGVEFNRLMKSLVDQLKPESDKQKQ